MCPFTTSSIDDRWAKPGARRVHPERLVGAVADQVAAELALGRLDRAIGLAGRNAIALREQLEVVDQRFHVVLHLLAGWWRHLVVVAHDRAGVGLQPAHALFDHPDRLANLGPQPPETAMTTAGATRRGLPMQ